MTYFPVHDAPDGEQIQFTESEIVDELNNVERIVWLEGEDETGRRWGINAAMIGFEDYGEVYDLFTDTLELLDVPFGHGAKSQESWGYTS